MNKYKALSLGKDKNGKRIIKEEHRKIMEEYLGRKLTRYEVVHHIDGDKSNNDINNLALMTLEEHSRLHMTGRKLSDETKRKISAVNKGKINKYRKKTKKDIINIVLKYKELKCYRAVDRYFGFSNSTTRDIISGKQYNDYQSLIKKILNEK